MWRDSRTAVLGLLVLFSSAPIWSALAKTDSLVFSNGDAIVVDRESRRRGILTIETDSSDSDFRIDWGEVQQIFTSTHYVVILANGKNSYGRLRTEPDRRVRITTENASVIECDIRDMRYLQSVREIFGDRIEASVDMGSSLTRGQNMRQLTTKGILGYKTRTWSAVLTLSSLRSE